jgi:hypothetical protein
LSQKIIAILVNLAISDLKYSISLFASFAACFSVLDAEMADFKMKMLQMKAQFQWLLLPVLAICVCGMPAMASTLFSDLGPSTSPYNGNSVYSLLGSGSADSIGESMITANLFTVTGSGSLSVTQIDLAVGNLTTPDMFYASIFTDSGGVPGEQVAGADWSLFTSTIYGTEPPTLGLVSVTGISGVDLTGGQQYFMVLGPLSLTDTSSNGWFLNNQGANGLVVASHDGGATWAGPSESTLGAFDVLSGTSSAPAPEPGSQVLLWTGLIAMLGACRHRSNR